MSLSYPIKTFIINAYNKARFHQNELLEKIYTALAVADDVALISGKRKKIRNMSQK